MKSLLRNDTYLQQSNLAQFCRTGELKPIKGLTGSRVNNYRRLVYNVIDDSLQAAYPLTNSLLNEDEWGKLVDAFFRSHACQSYSLWKMPYEFYLFTINAQTELKEKYFFLLELMLFEWTEIELYMMEDKNYPQAKAEGNWLTNIFELNPEHKILRLGYPVHLKNPKDISAGNKGDYYVLLYRDRETGKINFINLSKYFAWLIEIMFKEEKPLGRILNRAENIFGIEKDALRKNTFPFIEELLTTKFLLGFKV